MKYPIVLKATTPDAKVPLLGEINKSLLENSGATRPRKFKGPIRAKGIYDKYVVRPAHRFQTPLDILFLVQCEDEN
jgi:hypothetical protein